MKDMIIKVLFIIFVLILISLLVGVEYDHSFDQDFFKYLNNK